MDRILIISDTNAPYRIEVFKGLAKSFDTTVFFHSGKSQSRDPSWYVKADRELAFDILDNQAALAKYKQCLKELRQYALVLCYDPWHSRSRALMRLCMRKNIPFILNADGAQRINTAFPKKQIKTFYTKRAARVFAGCERAAQYFFTYGAKPEAVVKHPFTSLRREDLLPKPLSAAEKSALRQELGVADVTTLIAVGQFIPRKGFDLLLHAWEKTSQTAQLLLVGGGPLRQEYEDMIAQRGLRNVLIEDFMPSDRLFRYYLASDICVMPTREDIWGLVVNEAMANGLPVISSDRCTAANELVIPNQNGNIYPCENTDRLACYIEQLVSDPDRRLRYGKEALHAIRDHVYENVIASHTEEIRAVIAAHRR